MSEKEKADAYSEGWKEGVEEGVKYAEEDRVIRIRREREANGFPYRYFIMFVVFLTFFSYGVRVIHELRNNKDFISRMENLGDEPRPSTAHFFDFDDSLWYRCEWILDSDEVRAWIIDLEDVWLYSLKIWTFHDVKNWEINKGFVEKRVISFKGSLICSFMNRIDLEHFQSKVWFWRVFFKIFTSYQFLSLPKNYEFHNRHLRLTAPRQLRTLQLTSTRSIFQASLFHDLAVAEAYHFPYHFIKSSSTTWSWEKPFNFNATWSLPRKIEIIETFDDEWKHIETVKNIGNPSLMEFFCEFCDFWNTRSV